MYYKAFVQYLLIPVLCFHCFLLALVNLIGICYLYGYDNYEKDMTYMLGRKPSLYWKITWKYLAFILIIPVMILELHAKYVSSRFMCN